MDATSISDLGSPLLSAAAIPDVLRSTPHAHTIETLEDGRILDVNNFFCDLSGYSRDELIGRSTVELQFWSSAEMRGDLISRIAEHGIGRVPFKLRQKNGKHRGTLLSMEVMPVQGRMCAVTTIVDAAEQPQSGSALTESIRQSEERRLLSQASDALARSLDYDETLKAIANLAICAMADWCSVHVVEDNTVRRVAVAHKDPAKRELADEYNQKYPLDLNAARGAANVLRTGKSELYSYISDELLVQSAHDSEHLRLLREVGMTSVMIVPLSSRGRTFGVLSLVSAESGRRYDDRDLRLAEELGHRAAIAVENAWLYRAARREIEDRKRSEEAQRFLARAGEILASTLDYGVSLQKIAELSTPFLADYCVIDVIEEGDVIRRVGMSHANPERMELVRVLSRYAPRDAADLQHHLAHALNTGTPFVHPNITDAQLQAHASKHNSPELLRVLRGLEPHAYLVVPIVLHGRVHGTIGFISAESKRDYGEREQAIGMDLARRAALAIENAKLYHRVVEEDRRKSDFIATLAHELRNPLAPIRNGVHLLQRIGPKEPELQRIREMIERQAAHMSRLVDDLLDISRVTRDKIALDKECVDFAQLARHVLHDYEHDAVKAGIRCSIDGAQQPVWVEGDRTRLSQVVGNLLHNALKFTPRGGEVSLSFESSADVALLRIRDTGSGIDPAVLPQLFEPFKQGRQGSDRAKGGLGLGLALVKGLIKLHGGRVWAESAGVNAGATFFVQLPLSQPPRTSSRMAAAIRPGSPRKVLLVEDNFDAAESMSMLLQIAGHEVVTAGSGAKALSAVQSFKPDVVICDIGLPDMDGYTVCRELRKLDATRSSFFLALTGYGQEEDQRRAMEAGFDRHLTKPIEPAALDRIIAGYE
ncbi:MAG TPA: ATP-binding protein [Planctomycetota bacterium]|nr:ATP-binding protein [Planctomycetota bacterium]